MEGRKVVFVGAGPVGLWTSIQVKVLSPETQVIHYEKYEEYKRSHVLYVDYTSLVFRHSPSDKDLRDSFARLVERLKTTGKVHKTLLVSSGVSIRTNDLEQLLKEYALSIGIEIRYEEVRSVEDLLRREKGVAVLVGADGSHSTVRKQVFNDEKQEECLQYTVELKCELNSTAEGLTNLAEDYYTLKLTNFVCVIFAGKAKDGFLPASIRMFVDESSYNAIEATFKHPLRLQELPGSFPRTVRDDIVIWLNLLKKRGFTVREGTDKITKTPLNSYHADRYCRLMGGTQVYLVGDAAAGFPYLRALNAGLILGSSLGNIIANQRPLPLFRYNTVCGMRVTLEESMASMKNGGLNFFKSLVKLNAKLPSLFRWDSDEADKLRQEDVLC